MPPEESKSLTGWSTYTGEDEENLLLADAYTRFLRARDCGHSFAGYPLGYDLVSQVRAAPWKMFIDDLIAGDLNETINLMNSWCRRLMDWQTWLTVFPDYDFEDAWTVQDHFLEPLIFQCMSQPSGTRDRLAMIATNALHQTFRCLDGRYADVLDQDRNSGRPLSRKASETQLSRLGKSWATHARFQKCLERMDTTKHRTLTRNFRNLSHHGIAPRVGHGSVNFVARSIVPKTSIEQGPGGFYFPIPSQSEKFVQYAYGPTPALDSSDMFQANKAEFVLSVDALHAYQDLLKELLAAPRPKSDAP